MQRKPKGKLAVAITAALQLPDDNLLFQEAKRIVVATAASVPTDHEARQLIGGITPNTWCRWKRRCGLEVKVTNPGGQHVGQ